ncbi:MAG: hypothetical protein ACD_23C00163G0001, partial [uncultured bacterium]
MFTVELARLNRPTAVGVIHRPSNMSGSALSAALSRAVSKLPRPKCKMPFSWLKPGIQGDGRPKAHLAIAPVMMMLIRLAQAMVMGPKPARASPTEALKYTT